MDRQSTLKELGDLATTAIGFCIGISWRSITRHHIPAGMISARCRLAAVLFSGFAPAYRFHALLNRMGIERLPHHHVRLMHITHDHRAITGVAVSAIVSPDSRNATGFLPAPAHDQQPGYHRYFRQVAARANPARPWWDDPEDEYRYDDERSARTLEPDLDACAERDDLALELILDRLEAEYDEKLWWYREPGRRTRYPPALGSVRELFAYARKQELAPEEVARRNREQQAEAWLTEQRARERQRQQALDADQAEVLAALSSPRSPRCQPG